MSEPQKKNNFNPARLNWFNLDNRYATKQDLINSNRGIRKDIKLSETKLESQINKANTKNESQFNKVESQISKLDTKLSADLDAKIAKSQLNVVKWVISTGVAVIGAMAALKFF